MNLIGLGQNQWGNLNLKRTLKTNLIILKSVDYSINMNKVVKLDILMSTHVH